MITGSTGVITEGIHHVRQFGGNVHYVSNANGDDNNTGRSPIDPLATIGAAIAKLSEGDAINVMAGTYTETGLDLNVNGCGLWFEIGAIIDPASGTALTLSGDYCKIEGMHRIDPAAAQIGLLISGDMCHVDHGMIIAGGTGISITGSGAMIYNYACGQQTVIAYDIQGNQTRITDCKTVGVGATYGYKINSGADTGVLDNCTSTGHTTSGFYIDTGSQDWTILNCSSGGGDGKAVDVDSANVWSNYTFDDEVFKSIDVDTAQTINLFKLTGTVKIIELNGHVGEIIVSAGAPTIHISVFSANGEVDITADPGPNIDDDVVGTVYIRNADSGTALAKGENDNTPFIVENGSFNNPEVAVIVGADDAADTFIRFNSNAACTDGQIHWHVKYAPITDDGFLEVV